MGIIYTRFEDEENNNIKFDSSKFDYEYDDATFDIEAAGDFENILLESGDVFLLIKQSTQVDGQGTIKSVSETEKRITAYITDISKKDRVIHDMGLAVKGNRKMYVKPYYTITSGGADERYEVYEGDILVGRDGNRWRVISIVQEPYIQDTKIYKQCVVQNIGLD